jgi:hypothetical protein
VIEHCLQGNRRRGDLVEKLLTGDMSATQFASGFCCASREQKERLLTRLIEHALIRGSVQRTQVAHLQAMAAILSPKGMALGSNVHQVRRFQNCNMHPLAVQALVSIDLDACTKQ